MAMLCARSFLAAGNDYFKGSRDYARL